MAVCKLVFVLIALQICCWEFSFAEDFRDRNLRPFYWKTPLPKLGIRYLPLPKNQDKKRVGTTAKPDVSKKGKDRPKRGLAVLSSGSRFVPNSDDFFEFRNHFGISNGGYGRHRPLRWG